MRMYRFECVLWYGEGSVFNDNVNMLYILKCLEKRGVNVFLWSNDRWINDRDLIIVWIIV